MIRFRKHAAALFTLNAALLFAGAAHAGWAPQDFGSGGLANSQLYTPKTPAENPAVLVAIHYCTGNSGSVNGWFDQYADQYGFYIIAPQAKAKCFDSSIQRGGEPAAIVSMVNWVITNKHADKSRVFAAGMSSGGCMTNTLLAAYPDVFVGGSAMPGYPAGGWQPGDTNCNSCSSSSMPPSTDGKYWGDKARAVEQWSGTYPCSQQWVGGGDQYGFQNWLPAVVAQWQNLASLDAGATVSTTWSGWTRKEYKDSAGHVRLQTNLGPSTQMHDIQTVNPKVYGDVIKFLSLDTPDGICGIVPSGSGGMGAGGASSGGAPGSGGATGMAGAPHTGGAPGTGGTVGAGGATSTGGTGTTGGSTSTGGTSTATGGTTSAGGTTSSGGTTSTGGTSTTGGSTSTGGTSTATGGSTSTTGGTTGTGGSTSASGGAPSGTTGGNTSSTSGGASTTNGSGGSDASDKGGCAVSVAKSSAATPFATLLVAGLAFFARRRRSRS